LRSLGAGATPKALADTILSAEGVVHPNEATKMVTNAMAPAQGGDCLGVGPAGQFNGSTVMEGVGVLLAAYRGVYPRW
jgi:hypothetical protein